MPLCDGAHRSDKWQCDNTESPVAAVAFAASYSLRNLADRLAHRYQGTSIHGPGSNVSTHKLVLVSDGHDIEHLRQIATEMNADQVIVLSTGSAAESAQWAFPDAECRTVPEGD